VIAELVLEIRVMVSSASLMRHLASASLMVALTWAAPVLADNDPAHALAEKFAGASVEERKAADAARRKAEEDEMLARARKEAAARAEAEKRRAVAAEEQARQARDLRQQEMEAAREAEAKRLAEKLKRAEEARRLKAAAAEKSRNQSAEGNLVGDAPISPPMALGRAGIEPVDAHDSRVTVLLVMEPGKKGIRRFNKTADPVLCQGAECFVSTGAATPARILTRSRALGTRNTFGKRAGACRRSLSCVFRGVKLSGAEPSIQPVDLKVLAHDRRAVRTVSGDASCRVITGRLSCERMIVAPGYRAWIVPESIAERAGAGALRAALARGLVAVDQREAALRN